MRTLLLMRGAPGCGKSTFIEENGLKPYVLSADDIRLLCQSSQQTVDGKEAISQNNEKTVWKMLFELLDIRMQNGEFTVIDTTNSKTVEMNRYKEMCKTYRYRIFCIDFTDLPIEECKRRNAERPALKQVPEEVIDKMYSRFRNQKIPSGIKVIKPHELNTIWMKEFDFSEYKKVVHIGDIHGCYTALMEYFKDGFDDDVMYIFLGDLIDRGIENAEVVKWFIENINRKNVLVLEGNHECFHKDTEVLTKNGWKLIKDIDITNDLVGQFNINTSEITYDNPLEKIENYAEELIDIESFDMHQVVTPNHDVVYRKCKIKAEDLIEKKMAQCEFTLSGNQDVEDYNISDDDLRLLVWIVSDGTIVRRKNQIYTRIQFHLSREDKIENLRNLLTKLNIKHSCNLCKKKENHKQDYMICFYSDSARYYDELLSHNKEYPEFFMQLSRRQMLIVMDEIIKTDGRKVSSLKYELTTINKNNTDIIQRLCLLNGATCTITEKDNSSGYNKNGKIYVLSIKIDGHYPTYKVSAKKIFYNDKVYCLTMPKGTLITRFNGKVAFTGNCHLQRYSHGGISQSKEFELNTKKQLEAEHIDLKDIRMLYNKLGQCAWYEYKGRHIFVSHAGIATMPKNLTTMATIQMIKGVGNYKDCDNIADTWNKTMSPNYYQIHGHRNVKGLPIKVKDNVFNLEGQVEFGGDLRILELSDNGFNEINIKNEVFKAPEVIEEQRELQNNSVTDVVLQLRANKFINEKQFGNISSFNFTKDAFYKKEWDNQTITARGLYIDTNKMKIAARSYEKFFNINERPETKFDMLKYKLQFPIACYVKENGFLGLISYDEYTDDLFITTKSSPNGDFAVWLKEMVNRKISKENRDKIKQYCKDNDVTFVVECVDMENDPHIIEYPESELFLLSIIKNDINFKQYNYSEVQNIGKDFGLRVKELAYVINDWADFFDWYNEILQPDYEYNGRKIEGFVIEDSCGFMTKLKLTYYNFWKFMRGVAHATLRVGHFRDTGALTTATANDFYAFCKKLYENAETKEKREEIPRDIVTLRRMFLLDTGGD